MEVIFLVSILCILCASLYMIPTFIAILRGHNNVLPICIVNFFFGISVVGWLGCLAWAFSDNIKDKHV